MDSCTLFEEDEIYVYTEGKGCKFGLVLENAEYYSSEDEENPDKDDTDDPERLKKGNIRVAWHPSGKETVVQEDKVNIYFNLLSTLGPESIYYTIIRIIIYL